MSGADGAPSGTVSPAVAALFEPTTVAGLTLPNRLVMAPMTRNRAPTGDLPEAARTYYGTRAAADIGLVITEGVVVDHPSGNGYRDVPRLAADVPTDGFRAVVEAVHAAGAKILPQLWHVGSIRKPGRPPDPSVPGWGPSAVTHPAYGDKGPVPHAMTEAECEDVIDAFVRSASTAMALGCDGVELHGAHGYLLDQFVWPRTNRRDDRFALVDGRARFTEELVRRVRCVLRPGAILVLRFSQWKLGAYDEVLWPHAASLARFLEPLVDAGVHVFHPSTRRLLTPAFDGDPRTLPGVVRDLTGRPVIAVGSVGLDRDILATDAGRASQTVHLDAVAERVAAEGLDLLAVGRAVLAEPRFGTLARTGRLAEATPYSKASEEVYP